VKKWEKRMPVAEIEHQKLPCGFLIWCNSQSMAFDTIGSCRSLSGVKFDVNPQFSTLVLLQMDREFEGSPVSTP
jgi:hypothetical protein